MAISKGEAVSKGDAGSGLFLTQNPVAVSATKATIVVIPNAPSMVKLVIFDNLGNLIDIQENCSYMAKGVKFSWNLTNRSGLKVGSGSYTVYATAQHKDGTIERYKRLLGVQQ